MSVEDKNEIEQLLYRYAWMVDERKWELIPEVFTEDATIDYVSTGGKAGPVRETLAWLDRALKPWPINMHVITNIAPEISGDRATARSCFMAPMGRAKPDGSQETITNAGYYFDKLVKTPRGWRIKERLCKQTIMIGQLPQGYAIPD